MRPPAPRPWWALLLLSTACGGGGGGAALTPPTTPPDDGQAPQRRRFEPFVVESPYPRFQAEFGAAVQVLDFDGDGIPDLAVGAPGEGYVYVARGGGDTPFRDWRVFGREGLLDQPLEVRPGRFGAALCAADLDGDGDDELLVGEPEGIGATGVAAGAVHVLGGPGGVLSILSEGFEPERFGNSVVAGDLDRDGVVDLAVGAYRAYDDGQVAGRVELLLDPLGDVTRTYLYDPNSTDAAAFGSHLALDDLNGDGYPDLLVAAVGNPNQDGVEDAGQVVVYDGPLGQVSPRYLEDRRPDVNDPPRFGMDISARGGLVAVGAPRKDQMGDEDVGSLQTFSGAGLAGWKEFLPEPFHAEDLLGYRVLVADLVGGTELDVAVVRLAPWSQFTPEPANGILVWDSGDSSAEPVRIRAVQGYGSHFGAALHGAQLVPGGWEELIVGDPRHDVVFGQLNDDRGRVVVYF